MTPESAPVIQKAYELSLWILPKVERFPRSYRFTVGDRITAAMLDLLTALIDAAYSARRDAPLQRAQQKINTLRFLVRMAKDLHILGVDSYGHVSERVEEIGRMTGGWRKAATGA